MPSSLTDARTYRGRRCTLLLYGAFDGVDVDVRELPVLAPRRNVCVFNMCAVSITAKRAGHDSIGI